MTAWLAALAGLVLAGWLDAPHLLPVRAWAAPALAVAGLAAVVFICERRVGWRRYLLAVHWLVTALWSAWTAVAPEVYRQALFRAADREPDRLAALGEHLVIGYDDPAEARELARRGLIGGLFVGGHIVAGKTAGQFRAELAGIQAARRQAGLPPLLIATDQEGGPVSR